MQLFGNKPKEDDDQLDNHDNRGDKQLELMEHLVELRTRLFRSIVYVAVGMMAGWIFYKSFFFPMLSGPISPYLKEHGSKFLITGVAEGFTLRMQISLFVGLILAMPLITLEGWRFVAPGLTRQEKKGVHLVAPLSIILFCSGVYLAYKILPVGIEWLASLNPDDATFMPSVQGTLLFVVKMCLAFGVVFQLPVVLMFLGKVGIVNSRMLISYWRQAVVVLAIVAAIATPSGDAFSMAMMAVPLVVLYGLSIGLVKMVEK